MPRKPKTEEEKKADKLKKDAEKAEKARREALTPEEREAEDRLKDPANAPTVTIAPVSEEAETVTIKRTDLDKLFARLDSQAKDISLLYKAADKGRLATEMNKEGQNLIKQVRVWTWDGGKCIIGWKLTSNKCEVVMGKWMEDQSAVVVLEDGETITVPYLEFVRKTLHKLPADIISRTEEYDDKNEKVTILKLQFPNGKVIAVNSSYVN